MRRSITYLVSIFLLLSLSACPPVVATGVLTINNNKQYDIIDVRVSPAGQADIGPNRLFFPVSPGNSWVITLEEGNYDVSVQDTSGTLGLRYAFPVLAGVQNELTWE